MTMNDYNSNPYILYKLKTPDLIEQVPSNIREACNRRSSSKLAIVCIAWLKINREDFMRVLCKITKDVKNINKLKSLVDFIKNEMGTNGTLETLNSQFELVLPDNQEDLSFREGKYHIFCLVQYIWLYVKRDGGRTAINNLKSHIKDLSKTHDISYKQLSPEHIRDEYLKMYELVVYNSLMPANNCSICLDGIYKLPVVTVCGHIFHDECIRQSLTVKKSCPVCRVEI